MKENHEKHLFSKEVSLEPVVGHSRVPPQDPFHPQPFRTLLGIPPCLWRLDWPSKQVGALLAHDSCCAYPTTRAQWMMQAFLKNRDHSPDSLLLGVLNSFLRCVRPLCHCWCPPYSAGHVAFLSFVSHVCHWWCPPFFAGEAAFLFIPETVYC